MSSVSIESVLSCPAIPSLPAVAMEVLELTRDRDVKFAEIARVVQNDQALSTKILRTVNSSYYGLSQPCPSISRALAYLGLSTVKSLVLGFSLVDLTKKGDGDLDLVGYWRRGLYAADAARQIALLHDRCDPEEAFTGALMQDLGILAIHAALKKEYVALVEASGDDHELLPDIEYKEFGFTHVDVGVRLGEMWRLADHLIGAIQHHHDYEPTRDTDYVRTVGLGCQAAAVLCVDKPGAKLTRFIKTSRDWFGIENEDAKQLLADLRESTAELARLFSIDTGDAPDINAILAEKEDAALQVQLEMTREADQLRESNSALAKKATTDGLTGLANRAKFDEELEQRVAEAKSAKGSVGLILTDLDKFKSVNDVHGHQVGDAVLIEAAKRMRDAVGEAGLPCRYGGEEFAVVIPNATKRQTVEMAEKIRKALEATPIDLSSVPDAQSELSQTSSFGAVVLEPANAHVFTTPQLMVIAADKALYSAKEGGRNCVRLFAPRVKKKAA